MSEAAQAALTNAGNAGADTRSEQNSAPILTAKIGTNADLIPDIFLSSRF
jgi:hypothetical protein